MAVDILCSIAPHRIYLYIVAKKSVAPLPTGEGGRWVALALESIVKLSVKTHQPIGMHPTDTHPHVKFVPESQAKKQAAQTREPESKLKKPGANKRMMSLQMIVVIVNQKTSYSNSFFCNYTNNLFASLDFFFRLYFFCLDFVFGILIN